MAYLTGLPYAQGMGPDGGQAIDWDALLTAHRGGRTNADTYKFVEDALRSRDYDQALHDEMLAAHQYRMGFNVHDPWVDLQQPDMNGMGNDGGQRTPTNTGATPSNGLEGSGGPEWTGPPPTPVDAPTYARPEAPAADPVSLWDTIPGAGGPAAGPGRQTPNWGAVPGQGAGGNPFPAAPQGPQQPGVGPAAGMDNFNNAAHSTWQSQYEQMMQEQERNTQNQQNIYPVGPRATRFGLLGDPHGGGLI